MKKTVYLVVILLFFVIDVFGQIELPNTLSVDKIGTNLFKKLQFSHSYSVNFINNGIGGSNLFGTYIGNIDFNLRKNLKVSLSVGIMNNFYSTKNRFNSRNVNLFIPDFNIVYKPFKNFTIKFRYSQMPYNYFYGNYYNDYRSSFMW